MIQMNCDCIVCVAYANGRMHGVAEPRVVETIIPMYLHPAIPMVLFCPHCKEQHLEQGKWKTTPHRTHACYHCRKPFTPSATRTFGVEAKDLVFGVIDG